MRVITALLYAIVVSAGTPDIDMAQPGMDTYSAPPPEYAVKPEDTEIQSNVMLSPPPNPENFLDNELMRFWDAIKITVSQFDSVEKVRTATEYIPKDYFWWETYITNQPKLMSILKPWTDPSLAVKNNADYIRNQLTNRGKEIDSAKPFDYFYPTDMAIFKSIDTIRTLSATAPTDLSEYSANELEEAEQQFVRLTVGKTHTNSLRVCIQECFVKMHILLDLIGHLAWYAPSKSTDWHTLYVVLGVIEKHTKSLRKEMNLIPTTDPQHEQKLENPANNAVSRILQNIDKEFAGLASRAWTILHPPPATIAKTASGGQRRKRDRISDRCAVQ